MTWRLKVFVVELRGDVAAYLFVVCLVVKIFSLLSHRLHHYHEHLSQDVVALFLHIIIIIIYPKEIRS